MLPSKNDNNSFESVKVNLLSTVWLTVYVPSTVKTAFSMTSLIRHHYVVIR